MMMNAVQVAKVCHEVNRAYCESLGDHSQKSWDEASEGIRASAVDGVLKIVENPGMTPEQSHESWMRFKESQGWKHGVEKNEERKEHPCMVPYGMLGGEQRAKDYIFRAVVLSLKEFIPMTAG